MTELSVGSVDVFVLDGTGDAIKVLILRRARGTRCTGAWEAVHGRMQGRERPEETALRELREETGLETTRLYNVTCQPFYLHREQTVLVAVVFAAFVRSEAPIALSAEHDQAEWVSVAEALRRLSWPRSAAALRDAVALVGTGTAGAVEDVLRVV